MRFTYEGKRITLTGIKDCTSNCLPLKGRKLGGLIRKGSVAQLVQLNQILPTPKRKQSTVPEDIAKLIEEYAQLFQKPSKLPPQRDYDHAIPLIAGVKPVNVKPYRYSPT